MKKQKSERTSSDIWNNKNVVSLDTEVNYDTYIWREYERGQNNEPVEQMRLPPNMWKDLRFITGGVNTADFICLYMKFYLGLSDRRITELFGIQRHRGTQNRINKMVGKMQFILGVKTNAGKSEHLPNKKKPVKS